MGASVMAISKIGVWASIVLGLVLSSGCAVEGRALDKKETLGETMAWFQAWYKDNAATRGSQLQARPRITACDANERWRGEFCDFVKSAKYGDAAALAAVRMAGFCSSPETASALCSVLSRNDGFDLEDDSMRREALFALGMRHEPLSHPAPIILRRSRDAQVRAQALAMASSDYLDADMYRMAVKDQSVAVRAVAFEHGPVHCKWMRQLAQEWLEERLKNLPSAFPESEDLADVRACVDFLEDCYAIEEWPGLIRGSFGEKARRVLGVSQAIQRKMAEIESTFVDH
ncbi:MAG: hypothetical protein IMZ44_02325 [Planctomycetes bacterium]|nr:hypothetical protein [Planctomycetota bacterium]